MIKDTREFIKCQAVQGVYSGLSNGQVFSGILRCNSWRCPACAPRKLSQLRKRMFLSDFSQDKLSQYAYKFATLTFGGAALREPHLLKDGNNNILLHWIDRKHGKSLVPRYDLKSMYDQMSKNFNKLLTALKKRYGKFRYFRVYEPHKDGVPHFHVLFFGDEVIPMDFRKTMERLWKKYGQGFIKLNVITDSQGNSVTSFKDCQHAINYLLKYLTKTMVSPGKYKRIFSASRGVIMPLKKQEWEKMVIVKGSFDDRDNIVEEVIFDESDYFMNEVKEIFGDTSESLNVNKPDVIMHRHLKTLIEKEY